MGFDNTPEGNFVPKFSNQVASRFHGGSSPSFGLAKRVHSPKPIAMAILITERAGYIGSHMAYELPLLLPLCTG